MEEKRKKYWEEQDAKKKEKQLHEDISRIRQDSENEIEELKSEVEAISRGMKLDWQVTSESINELRDEIVELKKENTELKEKISYLGKRIDYQKKGLTTKVIGDTVSQIDHDFISFLFLTDEIYKIDHEAINTNVIEFNEKLLMLNREKGGQLDVKELMSYIKNDLTAIFPNIPIRLIENAVQTICELKKNNHIELNDGNIKKAVEIFRVIKSIDKAEVLLLKFAKNFK